MTPTIPAVLRVARGPGWPKGGAVVRARGRRTGKLRGQMNKAEARYAATLEAARVAGQVVAYWYEAVKLRLAGGAWYTPDFMVLLADGTVEMVDVKGGHQEEAARVRIKVAAETYPLYRWVIAAERRRGGFVREEFGPPGQPVSPTHGGPHDVP